MMRFLYEDVGVFVGVCVCASVYVGVCVYGRGINHALDIIKVDLIKFLSAYAYASSERQSRETF